MAERKQRQNHFVLVHGACHGAWCWYKLKPWLEAAGHRVTPLDLTAAGINTKSIQEVYSLAEHTKPLLEILAALPADGKAILVGHSFGGLSLALASDMFPHKISAAVLLTAFMPDTTHRPSFVLDQYNERTPAESWLDTEFKPYDSSNPNSPVSMLFGPEFLTHKLYQLSPDQDLELAKVLVRPGSLFLHDLSKAKPYSKEGYGSVPRIYIVCEEDQAIPKDFQRWMIENFPVDRVMEIQSADHMAMLSKTQELSELLSETATLYI